MKLIVYGVYTSNVMMCVCHIFTKIKQMKKYFIVNPFFVVLFGSIFLLTGCDQITELAKKIIPDSGSDYNAEKERLRAQENINNSKKIQTSDNKLLTDEDLESLFSNNFGRNNTLYNQILYYKTVCYAAKCAKDAYNDNISNKTMKDLGFSPIGKGYYLFYDGQNNMKVDVGVREISSNPNIKRVIAISFRGTQPTKAWLNDIQTDLSCQPYENPLGAGKKCKIHFGFYTRYYEGFHQTIAPKVKTDCGIDVFNTNNTAFLIMSHSLGGAYGEILALDLICNDVSPNKIIAVGLASPPIGNKELYNFAQTKEATVRIFKIYCDDDPVPTMGLGAHTLSANPERFSTFGHTKIKSHTKIPPIDFWYHDLGNTYIPYLEEMKEKFDYLD